MKKNNPQGESIRIRLTYQLERKLIAEKNRTGKKRIVDHQRSIGTIFPKEIGKTPTQFFSKK